MSEPKKKLLNYFIQTRNCPLHGDVAVDVDISLPITHKVCGGEYEIIGEDYVSEEHPHVDVYRCKRCDEHTIQPDSPELDKVLREMTEDVVSNRGGTE